MRRLCAVLLGIAVSLLPVCAQQTFFGGPVEGITFDLPTQSFRAVIGFAGSATFGPALASGFDTGSVAPHANYGIGFQQGACVLVSGLDSAQASTAPIAGVNGQPDGISWAADGSVAILSSSSANWLQVLTGLPDAPQAGSPVDLSSLGGVISAVASDRHGRNIAVAVPGGVLLSSDRQNFVSFFQIAQPKALAFSQDGASLYVLDGSAQQLDIVAMQDGSFQTLSLDGLQDAEAVASGRDLQNRQVVYVASVSDQIFRAYDPSTQQVLTEFPLDVKPTGVSAFGQYSFIITSRTKPTDPLWLYTSAPQPAVYFVPAALSSGGLD